MLFVHMGTLQGRDLGNCADAQMKNSAFSLFSMAISRKDRNTKQHHEVSSCLVWILFILFSSDKVTADRSIN